jgi:hypothetical protein
VSGFHAHFDLRGLQHDMSRGSRGRLAACVCLLCASSMLAFTINAFFLGCESHCDRHAMKARLQRKEAFFFLDWLITESPK